MKKIGRLIDEMNTEKISNRHLRDLVVYLKEKMTTEIDPLAFVPGTAQIMPEKWHHHADHTDYKEHADTTSDGPSHGDYCD